MVALIQRKNYAANKGKTAGSYQFDTHLTGIGLIQLILGMTWYISSCYLYSLLIFDLCSESESTNQSRIICHIHSNSVHGEMCLLSWCVA